MCRIWLNELTVPLNLLNRRSSFHPWRSQCACLGLGGITTMTLLVVRRGTNKAIKNSLTQRLVSSLVSKVDDSISVVAPFTVGAPLILKDIWRVNGQCWDDELPKDTVDRFLPLCVKLPRFGEITISRIYFSGPFQHLELIKFGDSVQDGFSAVSFVRAWVTCTSEEFEQVFCSSQAKSA